MNMNPFNPSTQPVTEITQPAAETQPMTMLNTQNVINNPQPECQPVEPAQPAVTPMSQVAPTQQMQQVQPAQPIVTPMSKVATTQQVVPQPNQTVTQQPSNTTEFYPTLQNGQVLISKFSPAKFDAFVKVLNVLDDRNIIVINQSNICQGINNGTAVLITDISGLIDDTNNRINLHVLNPKKYIRHFKNIKGTSPIYIIDDPNSQRYIVTNGDVMIYLPKQIEEFEKDAAPPDLTQANVIGNSIDIDKDTRNTITSMSTGSHIDLLLHQNQLKAVYVPELAVYSFKQYVADQIDDSKAELRLRSYSFLSVPGEEYRVNIGELNGNYWMTTLVNTGFIAVHIIEALQPVNDENLIL